MDKYAVVTDDTLKKQGSGDGPSCPECGSKLISENPDICPKCGSKPMEKEPEDGEKK